MEELLMEIAPPYLILPVAEITVFQHRNYERNKSKSLHDFMMQI